MTNPSRLVLGLLFLTLARPVPAATIPPVDRAQYLQWGTAVYNETVHTLGIPGERGFAESANLAGQRFGGSGGHAFAWPMSAQFRVQNDLARIDPATYVPVLREFSDQLHEKYWATNRIGGGYRSGVTPTATRFYDDNAHLAVALTEAYQITRDPVYLDRAKQTMGFVFGGENTVGGGGIYWSESDRTFKDSVSTLQAARAALMIHQATGDAQYLTRATRLYDWARRNTQLAGGTFWEKLFVSGPRQGIAGDFDLINAAGIGISTNLEFYDSTGEARYLDEAKRIGTTTLTRYFGPFGRIDDEGYWAYELADALIDLQARDPGGNWLGPLDQGLRWLHDNKQDPNGHYGLFWGREGPQRTALPSWNLNDNAPVARAYLHMSLAVPEPAAAAGLLIAAACGMLRRRR